jgi:hypothetical protein
MIDVRQELELASGEQRTLLAEERSAAPGA